MRHLLSALSTFPYGTSGFSPPEGVSGQCRRFSRMVINGLTATRMDDGIFSGLQMEVLISGWVSVWRLKIC